MSNKVLGMAAATLLVAGCASGTANVSTAGDGFALTQHSPTTLEATMSEGGAALHMLITESAPKVVDLTYDFGQPVIAFHIDFNQGAADFMPSGQPLDAAHSRLVDDMLGNLEKVVASDDAARTTVENATMRQTSFMQIVPVGEPLTQFHFVAERGWVSIGCGCGTQYIGAGYYRQAGVGCGCTGGSGHGCKGRCGQGCGGTSTPHCSGTTAYTQDCGRHDYGLASFSTASDDYAFAPNNCGCVGGCY